MKAPPPLRRLARWIRGLRGAQSIDAKTLRVAMAREPVLFLALGDIDARLPGEQRQVTLESIGESLAVTDKDRLIVSYCVCMGDSSSARATLELRQLGFSNSYFLDGGAESLVS